MKHFIINPNNGAHVEAHGVTLAPGHEIEVTQPTAEALQGTYEFLGHRTAPGTFKPRAKAKRLAQPVHFSHVTADPSDPQPDMVIHGNVPAAAPVAKKVTKKKVATKK